MKTFHTEINEADTPMDSFGEKAVREQYDWLLINGQEHCSANIVSPLVRILTDPFDPITPPITNGFICPEWLVVWSAPVKIKRGLSKIGVTVSFDSITMQGTPDATTPNGYGESFETTKFRARLLGQSATEVSLTTAESDVTSVASSERMLIELDNPSTFEYDDILVVEMISARSERLDPYLAGKEYAINTSSGNDFMSIAVRDGSGGWDGFPTGFSFFSPDIFVEYESSDISSNINNFFFPILSGIEYQPIIAGEMYLVYNSGTTSVDYRSPRDVDSDGNTDSDDQQEVWFRRLSVVNITGVCIDMSYVLGTTQVVSGSSPNFIDSYSDIKPNVTIDGYIHARHEYFVSYAGTQARLEALGPNSYPKTAAGDKNFTYMSDEEYFSESIIWGNLRGSSGSKNIVQDYYLDWDREASFVDVNMLVVFWGNEFTKGQLLTLDDYIDSTKMDFDLTYSLTSDVTATGTIQIPKSQIVGISGIAPSTNGVDDAGYRSYLQQNIASMPFGDTDYINPGLNQHNSFFETWDASRDFQFVSLIKVSIPIPALTVTGWTGLLQIDSLKIDVNNFDGPKNCKATIIGYSIYMEGIKK